MDDVSVLDEFSFVTVPFEEAEIILDIFRRDRTSGIRIKKATPRSNSRGGRGGNRGGGRGRKPYRRR